MTDAPPPGPENRPAPGPVTGAVGTVKRRVPLWDNARFLCVTLVVIGHGIQRLTADSDPALIVYLTVYAFHMPAFAVISGYFSKSNPLDKRAMRKVVTDILVPYVIMETIWTVVQFLVEGKQEVNPTKPSWTLWFLLALGIFRLILPYLALLRWPFLISIVLSIGVSFLPNVDETFSLARAIGILPFFVFGWKLRNHRFGERMLGARFFDGRYAGRGVVDVWTTLSERAVLAWRAGASALFVAVALTMTLNITLFREIDLRYWFFYDRSYDALGETEWWAGLFRLFLLVLAIALSVAFLVLVPRRKTPMTSWGQATMYVYLLHSFLLYPLRETGVLSGDQSNWLLVGMIVFCVLVSIALSTKLARRVFRPLIEPKPRWIFAERSERSDKPGRTEATDAGAPAATAKPRKPPTSSRVDPTGSKRDR